MKKTITTIFAVMLFGLNSATADEKYDHFPSLEAPDTQTALCNLLKFNEKLSAITGKTQLTTEDMVKVHELTYTLENAVIRLQKNLETIAVDLEKAHKASEHLDKQTVKDSGEKYLAATQLLLKPAACL